MRAEFFLSYSNNDRDAARSFSEGLKRSGISMWCAAIPGSMRIGVPWISQLRNALEQSTGYFILVGKAAPKGWVSAELDYALNRQAHEDSYRIIPVLLPGAGVEALGPFLHRFQALILSDDPKLLNNAFYEGVAQGLLEGAYTRTDLSPIEECPFRGLEPFDEEDAVFFFGRQQEVLDLVGMIGETSLGYRRWLQIEGASGSGKSSLARAGLIPAMRRGWIDGRAESWRIVVCRPGYDPLRNLARALCREFVGAHDPTSASDVMDRFRADDDSLVDLAEHWLGPNEELLILIDQLEEVFTLARDSWSAARFDALLATGVEDQDSRLHLVTTIRSDFLGRFQGLRQLERILQSNASRYYLRRMGEKEIRLAVTGPARLAKLRWQTESLPDRIIKDALHAHEGFLSLLGHTLLELWKGRREGVLLADQYDDIGGVSGALARSADSLLDSMKGTIVDGVMDSERAKQLLLSLIKPGEDSESTRLVLTKDEALRAAGGGIAAERVLLRLSGQRGADSPPGAPTPIRLVVVSGDDRVELVHEDLIRSWGTLRQWIGEKLEMLRRRERLNAASRAWNDAGKPRGDLPGARLIGYYRESCPVNEISLDFLRSAARQLLLRRVLIGSVCAIAAAALIWFGRQRWLDLQLAADMTHLNVVADEIGQLKWEGKNAAARLRDLRELHISMDNLREHSKVYESRRRAEGVKRLRSGMDDITARIEFYQEAIADFECVRSLSEREGKAGWARVNSTIAQRDSCPAYAGREIKPREDLLPLRLNTLTRLWEFCHIGSGALPIMGEGDSLVLSGTTALVFILVPQGSFFMGAQDADPTGANYYRFAMKEEKPVHTVEITKPFFLSKYEMTSGQWVIMGGQSESGDSRWVSEPLLPANVSWNQFNHTMSKHGLLLPTEAQWEYACRAGTQRSRWSDGLFALREVAWYEANSSSKTHPVQLKKPNQWGFYDFYGNVWEWCSDWYDRESYRTGTIRDPIGSSDAPSDSNRVLRGAAYWWGEPWLRSASRGWNRPDYTDKQVGVRPVLPAEYKE